MEKLKEIFKALNFYKIWKKKRDDNLERMVNASSVAGYKRGVTDLLDLIKKGKIASIYPNKVVIKVTNNNTAQFRNCLFLNPNGIEFKSFVIRSKSPDTRKILKKIKKKRK